MSRLGAAIVGGSGYTGGELLRLLLAHPHIEVRQVTSERRAGKTVTGDHPNLRRRTTLTYIPEAELAPTELLFLCLPHGEAAARIDRYLPLAERIIDLSADFRLRDAAAYEQWYGWRHPRPELLDHWVYGVAELHRHELRDTRLVAGAGCNATVSAIALRPLYQAGIATPGRTVIEVKVGSSEGGKEFSAASHHPERSNCLRSYKPTGHRHAAELAQELPGETRVHLSLTATGLVRGALMTAHVFPSRPITEKDLWRLYRDAYGAEPFVRIVRERDGVHRLPEPKLLWGSNYCDIGFEVDEAGERIVVIAAIDNLMKGAAGQAVQAANLMCGFPETAGLDFPGLHPV